MRTGFNPPLSPLKVEAFEAAHGMTLPTPYRRFVTELGNGGAGPFYGVPPLELELPELLRPFPYTQATTLPDDDEAAWEDPIPGAIMIAEYGCGIYFLLVVRGELAGQVWVDARYETGISPVTDDPTTPVTLDVWWLGVMRKHLGRFERVLAFMDAETDHEEIHRHLEPRAFSTGSGYDDAEHHGPRPEGATTSLREQALGSGVRSRRGSLRPVVAGPTPNQTLNLTVAASRLLKVQRLSSRRAGELGR